MKIDGKTKLIARFHPEQNNRGLNIYNLYFRHQNINAIYLLFSNPDPKKLFLGLRSLDLPGAIVAGNFEKDPSIPELLDEVHPISQRLGTIGMVSNRNGKLWGLYQGGYGLHDSILKHLGPLSGKSVSLVGAGNVARALILVLIERGDLPESLKVYNRTLKNAEDLGNKFGVVTEIGSVADLTNTSSADVLINVTQVGSAWCSNPSFEFTEAIVSRHTQVADVAFVPISNGLSKSTQTLGKEFSPGYQMFLFQAKKVLEEMLEHVIVEHAFSEIMLNDFKSNWS